MQRSTLPRFARSRGASVTALALAVWLAVSSTAASAGVPFWQRVLRWMSGESSDTPVQITMMGPHLQLSVRQPPQPDDAARAEAVRTAALAVMDRYRDVKTAQRDGYRPFNMTGQQGEEIHYTNMWRAGAEKNGLDYSKPGSLLYRRDATA